MLYTTSLSMRRGRIYKSTDNHTIKTRCIHSPGNTTAQPFSSTDCTPYSFFFLSFLPIIFLNEKSNFDILRPFLRSAVHILIRRTSLLLLHIPTHHPTWRIQTPSFLQQTTPSKRPTTVKKSSPSAHENHNLPLPKQK